MYSLDPFMLESGNKQKKKEKKSKKEFMCIPLFLILKLGERVIFSIFLGEKKGFVSS